MVRWRTLVASAALLANTPIRSDCGTEQNAVNEAQGEVAQKALETAEQAGDSAAIQATEAELDRATSELNTATTSLAADQQQRDQEQCLAGGGVWRGSYCDQPMDLVIQAECSCYEDGEWVSYGFTSTLNATQSEP